MDNRGFTLLETMAAVVFLTFATITLYNINLAMTRATLQQESHATVRDDGRLVLQRMSRMLRMARETSIVTVGDGQTRPLDGTAVSNIQFVAASDADGNGTAINADFSVEWSDPIQFAVDTDDANGDGFSTTQLAEFDQNGDVVRVLTNDLNPSNGISFQTTTGGVLIQCRMLRPALGQRPRVVTSMSEVVSIRN